MNELFCPGPVNVYSNIQSEINKLVSHRSEQFRNILEECKISTLDLFKTNIKQHTPLFLTGSGTMAIEAMIYSYVRYKKVLILSNGFFGERWIDMCKSYNTTYRALICNWNEPYDYELIEKNLTDENFDCVFFVHHETSTTMINDIYKLNDICRKKSVELISDIVSSAGIYDINLSELKSVSMVGFSTNKCIGSYPGLSIVISKNIVFDDIIFSDNYLNLKNYHNYIQNNETPYTPCVQSIFAYKQAMINIKNNTNIYAYYENLMTYFITNLKKEGFYPVLKHNQCVWVVNIVCADPDKFYKSLSDNNITIYRCKKHLQANSVQIAIFNKNISDIDKLLSHIKKIH